MSSLPDNSRRTVTTESRAKQVMGTLAWGERTGGRIAGGELIQLIANLAFIQTREGMDYIRSVFGALNPAEVLIETLSPPDTALVRDALVYAEKTHAAPLLRHSWRTYYFGALIAAQERLEFDRELFFASAILHDVALTEGHPVGTADCCFAISGAARVRDHLHGCGHPPEQVREIADAIALHLNLHVSRRKFGAAAYLVARGASCDLFGTGFRRLSDRDVQDVLGRYPRDGVIEALQFETATHLSGSRPAILTRLAGGKAPATRFDRLEDA